MIRTIAALDGPAYVQITREPAEVLFDDEYCFEIGPAVTLREGRDATLVSTGGESVRVYEAAEILSGRGIEVGVLHVPTLKPLDGEALVRAAAKTGYMITIEEQSVLGGLGGAVAEVLADRLPTTVKHLGIRDCFGESGPNELLLDNTGCPPRASPKMLKRLFASARVVTRRWKGQEVHDRAGHPPVAIVTGSASGIGRAAALRLARDGHSVAIGPGRPDGRWSQVTTRSSAGTGYVSSGGGSTLGRRQGETLDGFDELTNR
ncbi:MAG: transketolase C-terminal domain-containing protein [Acidimicrobiales bacterium]